ncbi:hypothetical protein [Enterovirga sp. CN4-39]|uniref:hypothetical protein n=1 Tax=Enterovirga sp. CN4-39 TaxID=3400910 RepID=UPI003C2B41CA
MQMTHGAALEARLGNKVEVRAAVDPRFMLAIGVLVSGILLSIPPIIRAAREGRGR